MGRWSGAGAGGGAASPGLSAGAGGGAASPGLGAGAGGGAASPGLGAGAGGGAASPGLGGDIETRMTNVENRLESMETKLNTLLHNSVSQTKPDRPQFDMSIKNKKYTTKNKANEEQGKEYTTRKHLD